MKTEKEEVVPASGNLNMFYVCLEGLVLEQEEKILQIDVDRLKSAKIGGQELLDARQLLADKQIEISQKETEQQQKCLSVKAHQ